MTKEHHDPAPLDPKLRALVEELPASLEPARDLWPGIAARIRHERAASPSLWSRLRIAGPALVGALAALVLVFRLDTVYRVLPAPPLEHRETMMALDDLDAACVRARTLVEEMRADATPGADVLAANLAIIEGSIAETRRTARAGDARVALAPFVGSVRDGIALVQHTALRTLSLTSSANAENETEET